MIGVEGGDENYIRLPSEFGIHEHQIMVDFSLLQSDENQDKLLDKLHSKGAFRKFKNAVIDMDIEQDWFGYKDNRYINIAREWCETNRIEYDGIGVE